MSIPTPGPAGGLPATLSAQGVVNHAGMVGTRRVQLSGIAPMRCNPNDEAWRTFIGRARPSFEMVRRSSCTNMRRVLGQGCRG